MSAVIAFPTRGVSAQQADLDARAEALDIRASCIVEAPAGSGKTGLLMQRYLKLLAEPSVTRPEEVLAITFTRKATSELRERILAQLEAAVADAPVDTDFDRQTRELARTVLERSEALRWNVPEASGQLNIRTIDSISAEIASALPLLSGSGGARRPTADAAPLYRMAAERTLMQLGGADAALDEALRTVLRHRDGSLANVTRLLADMLADREQWGSLIPLKQDELSADYLDRVVRTRLERALESIVCAALARAAGLMPAGMLRRLTELAADLGMNEGYNGAPNPLAFCAARKGPPAEAAAHLDHWQALIHVLLTNSGGWRRSHAVNLVGFVTTKAEKQLLLQLIEEHKSDELCAALCAVRKLPPAHYPDDQWVVTKALFHVLRRALAELKVIFAERATCDFVEVSLDAREALFASPDAADDSAIDLALTSGGSLRHLLVDEMQDTSATQYQLIQRLTRSWDGATQTIFLVGDPKQSIYLFRQARVERFLRTMRDQRLGDVPLRALRLTANFRSQANLVHAVNHTFEALFPSLAEITRTHDTEDVPFVDAIPTRDAAEARSMEWHTFSSGTEATMTQAGQQARAIAKTIRSRLATPLPSGRSKPWSIAVLARARAHLDAVVAELKRQQIPFRAVGIDPLATRPEVLDMLALTRALLHPADRAAWLAVLRAPWCGLALADLLALVGEGPGTDHHAAIPALLASRTSLLSDDAQQLLARTWPVLRSSLATTGSTPLATHVERTWRSLGGDALLNADERRNVLRYLETLRDVAAEASCFDLDRLSARLAKLYAESASAASVELLTIHKAKGLEWDVVLVPALEAQAKSQTSDLLNWIEIDEVDPDVSPMVLAPIWGQGEDSDKLNQWLSQARSAREAAERKRLLYVLATRAREELHLFATVRSREDGEAIAPAWNSLLRTAWPAVADAFQHAENPLAKTLALSLAEEAFADDGRSELALAASSVEADADMRRRLPPPVIQRLPAGFDPVARFTQPLARRLPYAPACALPHAPAFERPEGSFAVRAFGNVVHRYLQIISRRLEASSASELLAELASWQPRLVSSLRGEGLSPQMASTEAKRALAALTGAMNDRDGLWILSPQASASTERSLSSADPLARTLRVDRTFVAGAQPHAADPTHRWIVDFKTTTDRGRSPDDFEAGERAKYSQQLAAYAHAARSMQPDARPIVLALYYPLVPRLLYWNA